MHARLLRYQRLCVRLCSGQAAALAGGTTMHIDFALPAGGDLAAGFARYQAAAAKSVMDYSFHMAVTSWDAKARSPAFQVVHDSRQSDGSLPG